MEQDIDLNVINENRSKRLKECRVEHGLSITKAAEIIGVNHSTLSRWEAGKTSSMKFPHLQKIAEMYHVNPDWLWGYNVPKTIESPAHKSMKDEILELIDQASDDELGKIEAVLSVFLSDKKGGDSK